MGEWKAYKLDSNLISFQAYNNTSEIRSCPEALKPFLVQKDPVAYVSYHGRGTKKGHIAHYLLKMTENQFVRLSKTNKQTTTFRNIDNLVVEQDLFSKEDKNSNTFSFRDEVTDTIYDINYKFQKDLDKEIIQRIIYSDRHDIGDFCKEKIAKEFIIKDRISFLDKIVQEPEFKYIKPNSDEMVLTGKKDFYNICKLQIGLDTARGCIADIVDGQYCPTERCDYCYAKWKNGTPALTSQFKINQKELLKRINKKIKVKKLDKKKPLVFRLGQRVEVIVPKYLQKIKGYKDNLKPILNTLKKIKAKKDIKVNLVTKIVEYDKTLADEYKKLDLSLFASVAIDSLEPGIVKHGFPTKKRLSELLKYAKDGVNSNIFVAVDITRGFEHLHKDAKTAVEFFKKNQKYLGIQFLDFRITKKAICEDVSGKKTIEEITYKKTSDTIPELNDTPDGKWKRGTNSSWIPAETHPDFLSIKSNGRIRLCSTHVPKEEQACGGCFMFGTKKTTENDKLILENLVDKLALNI